MFDKNKVKLGIAPIAWTMMICRIWEKKIPLNSA